MHTCFTNAQEHRDVAIASIPNTYVQRLTSDDSKTYLSSETEGCSKECLTGCGVNNKSLGTCGGPKQPKHNNISVIDGTDAGKFILGTDKRVSAGCKIPGVSLGYDQIQGVTVLVGCKIPGVSLGYDKSRQVKMKNSAVSLSTCEFPVGTRRKNCGGFVVG